MFNAWLHPIGQGNREGNALYCTTTNQRALNGFALYRVQCISPNRTGQPRGHCIGLHCTLYIFLMWLYYILHCIGFHCICRTSTERVLHCNSILVWAIPCICISIAVHSTLPNQTGQPDWALDCLVFCCTCTSLQCITFYCTGHCIVSERAAQRAIPCIRGQCRESYCSHIAILQCTETWRLIPCCSKLHNTIIQSRLQCTQLEWASSSLIL